MERNEESCEASRGIVSIPIVLKPIPVQNNSVAIVVEIRDVEVAIAVPHEIYKAPSAPPSLVCHGGLGIVFYFASKCVSALYQVASFFMKCYIHHTTQNRNCEYSRCMDTGFGSGKP